MSSALIHPPITALPSGGNIYNDHILQQACLHGFSLHSIEQTDLVKDRIISLNNTYDLLIWDSVFWETLAMYSCDLKTNRSGLLCHYLPSLNPKFSQKKRIYWLFVENQVMKAMRFIIVTGQLSKNEIRQRFPDQTVKLCTPGIDSAFMSKAEKSKADDSTTQLLTVANLLPEKGYLEILQSLAGLSECSWHWHICGCDTVDSLFTEQFWHTVAKFCLGPHISYHGIQPHFRIAGLMKMSDIFVAASCYESYGMALAEAAAMRLPIISTETGAASAIVKHGINGFLLQVGDQRALQDYLQLLIESATLRLKFRSRQHYHCQSWQECFATFRSICNQAVADTGANLML